MRGFEGSPGVRVVEEDEEGEAVVVERPGGKEGKGEEKLVFDSLVGDRGGSFGYVFFFSLFLAVAVWDSWD